MRLVAVFSLIVVGTTACVGQPSEGRPLSSEEETALREPVSLGQRILTALSNYPKASEQPKVRTGLDLTTKMPTVEVLHAGGYITDADASLSSRYKASLHPIPNGAPHTQPLLSMRIDRGELVFDVDGNITLRQHQ